MTGLCSSNTLSMRQAFQAWIVDRLITLNLTSGDLRMAAIAFVAGALAAAGNAWFQTIAARALKGAQFVRRVTAADTMVAAGER